MSATSSVVIDSDLIVDVQTQLDQAAFGVRSLIASEKGSGRRLLRTNTGLRGEEVSRNK